MDSTPRPPFGTAGGFPPPGGPGGPPAGGPPPGGAFPPPGGGPTDPPTSRPGSGGGGGDKGRGKAKGKDKDPKPPTRRTLSVTRLLALGLGVVAAILMLTMVLSPSSPGTFVVRAAAPVPALSLISESHVEAVAIDPLLVEEGTWTASTGEEALEMFLADIEGIRTQYPLAKNQQLRPELFSSNSFLVDTLEPHERLVSVHARLSSAVGGRLRVGDRVDVVSAMQLTGGDTLAGVVVSNVEVVGIELAEDMYLSSASEQTRDESRQLTPEEILPGDPVPGIYVLKVDADAVAQIATISFGSDIYLAYRNPDAIDVPVGPAQLLQTVCFGLNDPAQDEIAQLAAEAGTTIQMPAGCEDREALVGTQTGEDLGFAFDPGELTDGRQPVTQPDQQAGQ